MTPIASAGLQTNKMQVQQKCSSLFYQTYYYYLELWQLQGLVNYEKKHTHLTVNAGQTAYSTPENDSIVTSV